MNATFSVDRADTRTIYTLEVDSASPEEVLDVFRAWLEAVVKTPIDPAIIAAIDAQTSKVTDASEKIGDVADAMRTTANP